MWEILASHLHDLLQLEMIFLISVGTLIGLVVGVIPGMSGSLGVALLLPFSIHLDTPLAIGLLIGVYKAGMFAGSISAISFGTPGTPAAALDVLDGYPLMKQGKCKKAIHMALYASVIADVGSDLVLLFIIGPLAAIALAFGSREILALLMFSMVTVTMFIQESPARGLGALMIGILVSLIGRDITFALPRFTFGLTQLIDGIPLLPFLIGLLAFSQVLVQVVKAFKEKGSRIAYRILSRSDLGDNLTLKELLQSYREILVGFGVGTWIGALPGLGGSIATYISYAFAKRFSKNRDQFGKGALEGLAAAESANSATCGATFVPLFAFGIPGSPMAALFLTAFMVQGFAPGPGMIRKDPDMFYFILLIIIFANLFNLIWGYLLSPVFTFLAYLPTSVLTPVIGILAVVGTYSYNLSRFDVVIMVLSGVLGYLMRVYKFPLVAAIIGFIIAPMIEVNLRRTLIIGRGDMLYFFRSPISITILVLGIVMCLLLIFSKPKAKKA